MFRLRESDKHFLWSLIGAVGIILFWRGLWNSIDALEVLPNFGWLGTPALSVFVGLVILTFSGLIFQQFDPLGGLEKGIVDMLHSVKMHPDKKHFTVTYHDSVKKKDVTISARNLTKIEKNVLSIHEGGKEVFIPLHRVREVRQRGKSIWKL